MKKHLISIAVFILTLSSAWAQFTDGIRLDQIQGSTTPEFAFTVPADTPLERVILAISYLDGDPAGEFVSPDGKVLPLKKSDQVEVLHLNRSVMAAVLGPKPGLWKIRLLNSLGSGTYEVRFLTKAPIPRVTLEGPESPRTSLGDRVQIKGSFSPMVKGAQARIYLSTRRDTPTGAPVAEGPIGDDGKFQFEISSQNLANGEYFLIVKAGSKDGNEIQAMASGSFEINRTLSLVPVQNFMAAPASDTSLWVSFTDPYNSQSRGYRIFYQVEEDRAENLFFLGKTSYTLTGLKSGTTYKVWIETQDADGKPGPKTAPLSVVLGGKKPNLSKPLSLSLSELRLKSAGDDEIPVTISLSGSYSSLGGPLDLAQAQVDALPPGSTINWNQETWFLPSNPKISGKIYLSDKVPSGTYTIRGSVYNVGERTNRVPFSIILDVKIPPPTIERILPETWTKAQSVTIYGLNFQAGTQLYFDGAEQVLSSVQNKQITWQAPSLVTGEHQVRVLTPDGQEGKFPLVVKTIGTKLLGLKTYSQTPSGKTARFIYKVLEIAGETKTVEGSFLNLPGGWSGSSEPKTIGDQRYLVLKVQIPSSAKPGKFNFQFKPIGGDSQALTAEIASVPTILLSAFSTPSVSPGEEFFLWGDGFGTSAGQIQGTFPNYQVISWSEDEIKAKAPQGPGVDDLMIQNSTGQKSLSRKLFIKDFGFTLQAPSQLPLDPLEKKTLTLDVKGSPQPILWDAQTPNSDLKASLSTQESRPGEPLSLTVEASGKIQDGEFDLVLVGTSLEFQSSFVITIKVDKALNFGPERVPVFTTGEAIDFPLSALNPRGKAHFKLIDGQLPQGLDLTEEGKLSGKVLAPQNTQPKIQVTDDAGRTFTRTLRLIVDSPLWSGQSFPASPSRLAAQGQLTWTSGILGSVKDMAASSDQVALITRDGVKVVSSANGNQIGLLPVTAVQTFFFGGRWITLSADKTLQVWDTTWGKELWKRKAVDGLGIYQDALWISSGGKSLLVDPAQGNLEFTKTGPIPGTLGRTKSGIWAYGGKSLSQWTESEGWKEFWTGSEALDKTYSDRNGHGILDKKGTIIVLDSQGKVLAETKLPGTLDLVFGETYMAALGERQITTLDRLTLKPLGNFSLPEKGATVFGARDRLFISHSKGFQAINLYSGAVIWDFVGPVQAVGLSEGVAYISTTDNKLRAYKGADNLSGPTVKVLFDPPVPDGLDGWYIHTPQLKFSIFDKETTAKDILLKRGTGEYLTWTPEYKLPDGKYGLSYYGRDTHGLQQAPQNLYLLIDTTPPSIEWNLPKEYSGFSKVPLPVSWTFADLETGFDSAEYRINQGPWTQVTDSDPLKLKDEGLYDLEVRAKNGAGLWSQSSGKTLVVDFTPPSPKAVVKFYSGSKALLFLSGEDLGSGIDRAEYSLNNGPALGFTGPLAFSPGDKFSYQVWDRAGRNSGWIDFTPEFPPEEIWCEGTAIQVKVSDTLGKNIVKALPGSGSFYLFPQTDLQADFLCRGELEFFLWSPTALSSSLGSWEPSSEGIILSSSNKNLNGLTYKRRFTGQGKISLGVGGLPSGSLIFYRPVDLETLVLSSPSPAQSLYVNQKIRWGIDGLGKSGAQIQVRRGDGPWETVPFSQSYSLPYAEKSYKLDVKVMEQSTDSKRVSLSTFLVQNGTSLTWKQPVPGTILFPGQKFPLGAKGVDAQGRVLATEQVVSNFRWNTVLEKVPTGGYYTYSTPGFIDGLALAGNLRIEGQWRVYDKNGFEHTFKDTDFVKKGGQQKWSVNVLPGEYSVEMELDIPEKTPMSEISAGRAKIMIQGKPILKQTLKIRAVCDGPVLEIKLPESVKPLKVVIKLN